MAGGRSSGSGSSRGFRSGNDPLRRLAQLGDAASRSAGSSDASGPLANEGGLKALGDQMGGRQPGGSTSAPRRTGPGRHRRRRPRWSRKRRLLTSLGILVLVLALIAGGGYFYLQYEWGKVKKVACSSCVIGNDAIAPFNVLLIGSDTRVGDTGQAAKSFGTESTNGGQHSDTIKILHVDPKSGVARILSIPRDTWVKVTGLPQNEGLDGPEKINAAFNDSISADGPNVLAQTIENTFGIPINHFVVVDFQGLINAVGSVGGINMRFNYPVRDCSESGCYIDNSGLKVLTTGCQTLNGNQTLALARSRFFQYDDAALGGWTYDPSSDLGRIQRQNLIIEALIQKVESTYNPITLHSFLDSVVNDITIDKKLGPGELFDLANRYHAFSASRLQTFTLPTTPGQNFGGDVEIVEEPLAQQMIAQFLGAQPNSPTTPPLDVNSDPMQVTTTTSTTVAPSTTAGSGASGSTTTSTTMATTTIPAYDPTPC